MFKSLLPALAFTVIAGGIFASPCQAQWSFNFGYSEGYRGHHHHHPHWHGHYSYWYRPSYYYVAPPPVYVTPTVVTPVVPLAPAVSAVAPVAAPVAAAQPAATPTPAPAIVKSNSLPAYSGSGVTIRNPPASGGDVAFVVDERTQVELAPGESTPLKEKGSYTVTFDRGGNFGTTHRVLGEGSYEFVATDKGWELRRETLDGAALPNLPTVRRNELPESVVR
jgi:hypothetical protein